MLFGVCWDDEDDINDNSDSDDAPHNDNADWMFLGTKHLLDCLCIEGVTSQSVHCLSWEGDKVSTAKMFPCILKGLVHLVVDEMMFALVL